MWDRISLHTICGYPRFNPGIENPNLPMLSYPGCHVVRVVHWLKRFKPSSKILYWPFQGGTSLVDLLCFFSVLCLICLCERLFICALWSPAGKGLTSWLSFVVSNCKFVTFSIGILSQVWYLIVSIPDLCTLTYFYIGTNAHGRQLTSLLLLCDFIMWNCTSTTCIQGLLETYFKIKKKQWWARKIIHYLCEGRTEKSVHLESQTLILGTDFSISITLIMGSYNLEWVDTVEVPFWC